MELFEYLCLVEWLLFVRNRNVFFFFFFFQAEDGIRDYWRDWSSDVCSSDLKVHVFVFYAFGALITHMTPHGVVDGFQLLVREVAGAKGRRRFVDTDLFPAGERVPVLRCGEVHTDRKSVV